MQTRKFYELYAKNNNKNINYIEKNIQKYLIKFILLNNLEIDNPLSLSKFNENTEEKFLLNKKEIFRIRNKNNLN